MVYFKMNPRISIFLLFFQATTANAEIHLNWKNTKSAECQKLMSLMLDEMRAMANDEIIELNPSEATSNATRISVECESNSALTLSDSDEKFKLRYLGKNSGFDALDWLPIQKKIFKTPETALTTDVFPRSEPELSAISKNETDSHQSHKRMWFGSAAGAATGALGGALLSPNEESRVLNILVFGLIGAVAGAITGSLSDNNAN